MYIVDKNKDYYDHYSHIYGIDKHVVFDRRGSQIITDENIVNLLTYPVYNDENFVILEVGTVQYLIKVFKTKWKNSPAGLIYEHFVSCCMSHLWTFRNHKHYYEKPMSIREVSINYQGGYYWGRGCKREYILNDNYNDVIKNVKDEGIELPIIAKTQLTSMIDGEVIWWELQNYISSLNNDKDISIPMTDVEKAVTHGFDKKTSFRHPVK